MYTSAERAADVAGALARGARMLEQTDPDLVADLYVKAVEGVEEAGQAFLVMDLYREAVGCLVRMGKHADAALVLARQARTCGAGGQTNAQRKAYLAGSVVLLAGGDARGAWRTYQDAMCVDAFAQSDEAFACDALIDAYAAGDAAAVRAVVRDQRPFRYLEHDVSQLAQTLPVSDLAVDAAVLRQLGAGGRGVGGGGGGDGVDPFADVDGAVSELDPDDLT